MENQIRDSEINDGENKIVADTKVEKVQQDDTLYRLRVQRDAMILRPFKAPFKG